MRLSGFYNLRDLTEEQLKQLFTDCLWESHFIICESKYIKENRRVKDSHYSVKDMIGNISKKNHNVFIDRTIQRPDMPDADEMGGEVGFIIEGSDWYQITFYVRLDRLKLLAEKYNLIME